VKKLLQGSTSSHGAHGSKASRELSIGFYFSILHHHNPFIWIIESFMSISLTFETLINLVLYSNLSLGEEEET